jgi:hypothetical protein
MPEVEATDKIIIEFLQWTIKKGISPEEASFEEIEQMIDQYMRSRMAGG